MKRVLLFGGSFNPPHKAHLKIAQRALKHVQADVCWFIPSFSNPLKNEDGFFEERVKLVKAFLKGFRKFEVCTIEQELAQPSYTIQTIEELQKRYPDIEFTYLIGSDQALQFEKWKDSKKLLKCIPFYVYKRQKDDLIPTGFTPILENDIFEQSSTMIRQGDFRGLSYNVLQELIDLEMHLESIATSMVGKKRFEHISAMTKLALDLGAAHHLDLHQVYIAALFHDCAKKWSDEKLKKWISIIDPPFLHKPKYMWHARCGAYIVKHDLHVHNKDILKAITHHTEGLKNHPLTQCIYIADKCDETRAYDASELIKIAYGDLHKGYLAVKNNTKEFYEKGGKA